MRTKSWSQFVDTVSHGFALDPHTKEEGTPYGRAGYSLAHLKGRWYAFGVSDDY